MIRFGSLVDPPATFVLTGARIVDPASGEDGVRDLVVIDGVLADPSTAPSDAQRLDGSGLAVAPGLCDLHTHLREPGMERSETIESGARAAAHGGFTTVCAMPNTDPPLDEPGAVRRAVERASAAACRVRIIGAATLGREGGRRTRVRKLAGLGIVGVSDDGKAVASDDVARGLLVRLAPLGLPLIEHADDAALSAGSLMRAGPTATRLASLTYMDVLNRGLAIMDSTAVTLCMDNRMPIIVFDLFTEGNIERVILGEQIGTRVDAEGSVQ